jgi:hypothetical protein
MIVQLKLDLNDAQRRALRLAMGHRGGQAKRAEVKAWAMKLVHDALAGLDPAPTKRAKFNPETSPLKVEKRAAAADKINYSEIGADAQCDYCGFKRRAHGALGFCTSADPHVDGSDESRFQLAGMRVTFVPRPPKRKED